MPTTPASNTSASHLSAYVIAAVLAFGAAATTATAQTNTSPEEPVLAPAAGAIVTPERRPAAAPLPASGWTAQQVAGAFQQADTNRDGQLSRTEVQAVGTRVDFDAMDQNKDGLLSRSEFESGMR